MTAANDKCDPGATSEIAMAYRTVEFEVDGGTLFAGIWGTSGPVVVGSHGITGNHVSFAALADALGDDVRLVAPDHRGRGRSRDIGGPWGMAEHARDIVRLLDHLEIARAELVVGHSMGAFVAVVTAAEYPKRVGRPLLVDGGIPLVDELPAGMTTEQLIRSLIGPAMARLDMTFASREAYHAFWRDHPSLVDAWSSYLTRYFDYDLVGVAPTLRPSPRREAILGDTENQLRDDRVARSLAKLRGEIRLLRAPRGIMNGDPLYPESSLRKWKERLPNLSVVDVPDTNHYTILLGEAGGKAVAAEVRRLA